MSEIARRFEEAERCAAAGDLEGALRHCREAWDQNRTQTPLVQYRWFSLAEGLIREGSPAAAVLLLRELKEAMYRQGESKRFAFLVERLPASNLAPLEVLEFLINVHQDRNAQPQLRATFAQIFDLLVKRHLYERAGQVLARFIPCSPSDPQHRQRLDTIGKHLESGLRLRLETMLSRAMTAASLRSAAQPKPAVAPASPNTVRPLNARARVDAAPVAAPGSAGPLTRPPLTRAGSTPSSPGPAVAVPVPAGRATAQTAVVESAVAERPVERKQPEAPAAATGSVPPPAHQSPAAADTRAETKAVMDITEELKSLYIAAGIVAIEDDDTPAWKAGSSSKHTGLSQPSGATNEIAQAEATEEILLSEPQVSSPPVPSRSNVGNGLPVRDAGEMKQDPTGTPADAVEALVLEAETLLQQGIKSRAFACLDIISLEYPGAFRENKNLRALCDQHNYVPFLTPDQAGDSVPQAMTREAPDFAKVSEISRTIHRQTEIRGVLSTAVQAIGAAWQVDRCLASLCGRGKQPTSAFEYCAPGIDRSDPRRLVGFMLTLSDLLGDGEPLSLEDTSAAENPSLVRAAAALGIQSLLAIPLIDREHFLGVVVVEQCATRRRWGMNDLILLKALVDQTAVAASSSRLRGLVRNLSLADEATGVLGRSSYLDSLVAECTRARQQNSRFSTVLLRWGKRPGGPLLPAREHFDEHLQQMTHLLTGRLRARDSVIRYDDRTLAILLPGLSHGEAHQFAEKCRKAGEALSTAAAPHLVYAAGIAEAVLHERIDAVDSVTELINRLETAVAAAELIPTGGSKILFTPPQLLPPEQPVLATH